MLRRFNCLRVRFRCCWCRVCVCVANSCRRLLSPSSGAEEEEAADEDWRYPQRSAEGTGPKVKASATLWQTSLKNAFDCDRQPSVSSFVRELTLKWNAAARGYISHTCFLFKPKQQQIYKRDRNAKSSFHILNKCVLLTLWKLKKVIFCLNVIVPRAHVSSINR